MKIEITGHVDEKGKLIIPSASRKRLQTDLATLSGKTVNVSIKEQGRRSTPQNRYYHGVVISEIARELTRRGNRVDNETVHIFLKDRFNKQYLYDGNGEVVGEYGGSTTALNVSEFAEYLSKIIEWAASVLELTLPEPGEQTELFAA